VKQVSKHTQNIMTILMLGVVIVSSTLIVSLWLLPPEAQNPMLAILGENQQAGDYPTNVTQYSNITLYAEVENLMSIVQYFYVRVKLAISTTMANSTHPSTASTLHEREHVLAHGQTWIFPVQLNMTTSGINFRLTFELWRYDFVSDAIIYTGIWTHLPLNVTTS
jgi:uncharacterized membrane protein